jgi:NAD+ kinase
MSDIATVSFYRRGDVKAAASWERTLRALIRARFPNVRIVSARADLTIVLGGDGTIIEAVRSLNGEPSLLLGLNLGTVGFLASERRTTHFRKAVLATLRGSYKEERRMSLAISVTRNRASVYTTTSLNEVSVMNPMGMVGIDVSIDGHRIQHVHGTGVMVATPTGSTAFNLSAHGPIVDPRIECMVITEILDHNMPTPPIVVPPTQTVTLRVTDFRRRGTVIVAGQRTPVDVVYTSLHEKFSLT